MERRGRKAIKNKGTEDKKDSVQEPNNPNSNADSSQTYYIGFSGVRRPTSIRVDTGLWKAFKKEISAKGLSTCEILEKLMLGLTVGLKVSEQTVIRPTTINVYAEIPKFVRRVRRARVEYVDERVESFYCALNDENLLVENLPVQACFDCPNKKCKDYVLSLVDKKLF